MHQRLLVVRRRPDPAAQNRHQICQIIICRFVTESL